MKTFGKLLHVPIVSLRFNCPVRAPVRLLLDLWLGRLQNNVNWGLGIGDNGPAKVAISICAEYMGRALRQLESGDWHLYPEKVPMEHKDESYHQFRLCVQLEFLVELEIFDSIPFTESYRPTVDWQKPELDQSAGKRSHTGGDGAARKTWSWTWTAPWYWPCSSLHENARVADRAGRLHENLKEFQEN